MSGTLTLIFDPGHFGRSEKLRMVVRLDDETVAKFERLQPPDKDPLLDGRTFNQIIEVMRHRVYRRDFFINECHRLGALLAERMEDAEGWHDQSRIEPAKNQLKTGEPTQ